MLPLPFHALFIRLCTSLKLRFMFVVFLQVDIISENLKSVPYEIDHIKTIHTFIF